MKDEERKRNAVSLNSLFFHISHRMAPKVISFYEEKKDSRKLTMAKLKQKINPKLRYYLYSFPSFLIFTFEPSSNILLFCKPGFGFPYFAFLSDGMNGFAYISDKTIQLSEIYSPIDGMETIKDNQTMYAVVFFIFNHPYCFPLNFASAVKLICTACIWTDLYTTKALLCTHTSQKYQKVLNYPTRYQVFCFLLQ